MRVAHILRKYNPAEWGGTETALRQLIDGLRAHGVDSVVHAPECDASVGVADPLAEAGVPLRRFRPVVPVWGISEEERRQMVMIGGNLLSFTLVTNLWRERGIDVIHTHALGRLGGTGLAIARRRGLPLVVTIHGGVYDLPEKMAQEFHATKRPGWEWGKIFGLLVRSRKLLDEADAVLTCNVREAELLRQRHPHTRVRVQPHGIDASVYRNDHRAAARAAFPWIEGRRVILIPARVSSVKNQGWLVELMPAILAREPKALLVCAGSYTEAEYAAGVERRVRELGLEEHVKFTGGLPPRDPRLLGLMQSAAAMVLPSVAEPFGLVILEAWAAGMPVLASCTSGATELIAPGQDGELFELNRPQAFMEMLLRVLQEPVRRESFVQAGRAKVMSRYELGVITGQIKSLYTELIEARRGILRSA